MLNIPNSGAMDAAASGGGPSTVALPQLMGGNPAAILAHAAQVMQGATKLAGLLQDLERSKQQLREAWPRGSASDNAQRKLSNSFKNFNETIQAVFSGVRELEAAAAKLEIAQNAYRTIVNAVNPTVAALLSNPWTQAAARALATASTGTLSGFLQSIAGVLNAIGAGNIGRIVASLASVVGEIEKLFSKGGNGGGAGGGQYTIQPYPNPGASPVPQPGGMPQVASPSGQAVAGGYPGGGYPGGGYPGGGYPGGGYPGMPGNYYPPALNPNNGWVAVDPSAGGMVPGMYPPPTTLPAPAPVPDVPPPSDGGGSGGGDSSGDDDVTITASKGDLTVTVDVPIDTGRDFELDVTAESGGQTITQHVDVDADGSVSVK